jgi:hypothetical protein
MFKSIVLPLAVLLISSSVVFGQTVTVNPADNKAGLNNPDMGWYIHYYDNNLTQFGTRLAKGDVLSYWPGMTTCYFRLDWSDLEPVQGQYHWELVDSVAKYWIAAGKTIAFRVCAKEGTTTRGTPSWVSCGYAPDNPIFLRALESFLAVFGGRYNGKPYIAHVDVGTIGKWGEGWDEPSETAKVKAIDLHLKYFPNTLLVVNDDYGSTAVNYARSKGLTIRNDSYMISQPWCTIHSDWYAPFWPNIPTIVETAHYAGNLTRGSWSLACYLEMVDSTHASWCDCHGWPDEFWPAESSLVKEVNLHIGYRLQVVQASWPQQAAAGEKNVRFALQWRNAAVALCYRGGFPAIHLKNAGGKVVATAVDTLFNVKLLPNGNRGIPGPVRNDTVVMQVPFGTPAGQYQVFVSVGGADGTPVYELPYNNKDGNRRYPLGAITISGTADTRGPRAQTGHQAVPVCLRGKLLVVTSPALVTITDMRGTTFLRRDQTHGRTLQLGGLPSGVYMVRVSTHYRTVNQMMVLSR